MPVTLFLVTAAPVLTRELLPGVAVRRGNQLARTELRNLFRELLTRLTIVEFGKPDLLHSGFVHGIKRVPAFVR